MSAPGFHISVGCSCPLITKHGLLVGRLLITVGNSQLGNFWGFAVEICTLQTNKFYVALAFQEH